MSDILGPGKNSKPLQKLGWPEVKYQLQYETAVAQPWVWLLYQDSAYSEERLNQSNLLFVIDKYYRSGPYKKLSIDLLVNG